MSVPTRETRTNPKCMYTLNHDITHMNENKRNSNLYCDRSWSTNTSQREQYNDNIDVEAVALGENATLQPKRLCKS